MVGSNLICCVLIKRGNLGTETDMLTKRTPCEDKGRDLGYIYIYKLRDTKDCQLTT